ncbi:hypothetical protein GFY24_22835 [Nocardia sp. SYP-A9097]|uniref:hypothetical protein n=1 Tax=Nocardia sp. SYP-A9097 TaxID=2663237 RepID=UPI00129BBF7C|nr:hypothetical protein [Nocardia sp. SYP-A9097]MRH90240.1 hypothetical protein [Nocardia sp. SYP-A9097]
MNPNPVVSHVMPTDPVTDYDEAQALMALHVECERTCEAKSYLTSVLLWLKPKQTGEAAPPLRLV